MSKIDQLLESDSFIETLGERLREFGIVKSTEDLEDEVYELRNTVARHQRELSYCVKLISALAEGKQLTVIRHKGGTTINVTDPRQEADKPVWEKPQLKVVK